MYLAALIFDNKHEDYWNVYLESINFSQHGWVAKAHKLMCIRNSEISSLKIKRYNRGKITFSRVMVQLFKWVDKIKQMKWQKNPNTDAAQSDQMACILLQAKETGTCTLRNTLR